MILCKSIHGHFGINKKLACKVLCVKVRLDIQMGTKWEHCFYAATTLMPKDESLSSLLFMWRMLRFLFFFVLKFNVEEHGSCRIQTDLSPLNELRTTKSSQSFKPERFKLLLPAEERNYGPRFVPLETEFE